MRALQLTSLSFVVPAAIAVHRGVHALGGICFANAVISFFVHGLRSPPPWLHRLDNAAVLVWAAFNAGYMSKACNPCRTLSASLLAATCAVACVARRQHSLGSRERVRIHAAMHLSGALGTALLVI